MSWSSTMTITAPATWEDLRKRARHLENEVDGKLLSLNKIGVSLGSANARFDTFPGSSDKAPLLSPESSFESLSGEIEEGIGRLQTINDQMANLVEGSGGTPGAALQHTLQRHRAILRDYGAEFTKQRANIRARLDRDRLLGTPSRDRDECPPFRAPSRLTPPTYSGLRDRGDGFLRENEMARSSDRLLDEQISIAMETKDRVTKQRGGLTDIQKKINQVTKRYPGLNSLMQKISMKKRRDSLVVAAVILVCLILLFLYAIR